MRHIIFVLLLLSIRFLPAQTTTSTTSVNRKGFIIGLGIGGGSLNLKLTGDLKSNSSILTLTLPNIKLGYMLNDKLAICVLLPGANYRYLNKDRGFEGLILSAQYWIKNRWWILGGTGLTFDAPAFYTVKDPRTAGFYTGFPALVAGTGYEFYRKGRFTIDGQYRFFYGKSTLPNAFRRGLSNMFILGFNWY